MNRRDRRVAARKSAKPLKGDAITNGDVCYDTGEALRKLGRHEEALEWFDRALQLVPDCGRALESKVFALYESQKLEEAIALLADIKRIYPHKTEIDWNVSLIQLLKGDLEAGFRGREARWKVSTLQGTIRYPKFAQPMWDGGENINGKTILVCADEGLGDTIQFVRYAPMLANLGARVILLPQESLHPLLSGFPGVTQCLPNMNGGLPEYDLHCPVMSLPRAFRTTLETIPAPISYLPTPTKIRRQVWEERLGRHDRLRVGLVWSGNSAYKNDQNRSIPLHRFSSILGTDALFVSLQKDPRPDDQAMLRERPDIFDASTHLTDFSETAALISCLDLVITVDTSVAHLAGTLGCPTWILLPYTPDWRWLLDRDDSPWYPTVRLFRQGKTRDYGEVLDRVRCELLTLIADSANNPDALCAAGIRHLRAGRRLDAQLCCERALAVDSNHADTLHLMGQLSFHVQQYDHAVEWLARAIRQNPKAEYLASLGHTLQKQGRFEEALKAFDKAVQLKPEDTELWINLGDVLADLERSADAVLAFQHALKLDPNHWDAAYRSGFLLQRLGRSEQAVSCFDIGDRLMPNQPAILEMRAIALHSLRRFEQALADNRRAHELNPGNADTCNNIGAILQSLGRDQEALPWFDKALNLRPGYLTAFTNKASSLGQLHRFEEVFSIYHHMKAIDPGCVQADWDLALLHLLHGNFEAGWAGREARWKAQTVIYPEFAQPMWLGEENIEGKTILICSDEGLGDSIQFARYVPMVAARGARVILAVDDAVLPLLSELPGVLQSYPKSTVSLPPFDMHCPMSSLPLAFGTRLDTIPSAIAYLPAPGAERVQVWADRLGSHDKLRVGLVWSGNANHGNDHNRSIPLRTLSRLLDADATFVSLQKDARPDDKSVLAERSEIVDLTMHLTDFSETAALLSHLDLIITVDTSVAHLAAALGRPTWILLPYAPDYRWLLDRDDSPWYPTVRLFRQDARRDYASVVDRVRSELLALISARSQA